MGNIKDFKGILYGKTIPLVVLDPKWHQLFDLNGKPAEIQKLEAEINQLFAKQARITDEIKELKKLKSTLMQNIVQNMDGAGEVALTDVRTKKMEEDRRLIDEINTNIQDHEDTLLEIPRDINTANNELMAATMEFSYHALTDNTSEIRQIASWIQKVRKELKIRIINKQNRELMNKLMYSYMHDIFGANVIEIFDLKYEDFPIILNENYEEKNPETDKSKEDTTNVSQKSDDTKKS